jgi:hypothetical protein
MSRLFVIFIVASISSASFARTDGSVSSQEKQSVAAYLVNLETKALCGLDVNSQVPQCSVEEKNLAKDLAENSYSENPQVAGWPMVVGYYLACSTVNVGTAVSVFGAMFGLNNNHRDDEATRTYSGLALAGMAASATVCLPVSAINYGLLYLHYKVTGNQ